MAGGSSPNTTPASATNPGFSSPLSLAMPLLSQTGANNPFAALLGQVLRGAAQLPLQPLPPTIAPGGDSNYNQFMTMLQQAVQPTMYRPQTTPNQLPMYQPAQQAQKAKDQFVPERGNGSPSGRQGDSVGSPAGGSGNGGNGFNGH